MRFNEYGPCCSLRRAFWLLLCVCPALLLHALAKDLLCRDKRSFAKPWQESRDKRSFARAKKKGLPGFLLLLSVAEGRRWSVLAWAFWGWATGTGTLHLLGRTEGHWSLVWAIASCRKRKGVLVYKLLYCLARNCTEPSVFPSLGWLSRCPTSSKCARHQGIRENLSRGANYEAVWRYIRKDLQTSTVASFWELWFTMASGI